MSVSSWRRLHHSHSLSPTNIVAYTRVWQLHTYQFSASTAVIQEQLPGPGKLKLQAALGFHESDFQSILISNYRQGQFSARFVLLPLWNGPRQNVLV